MNLLKQVIGTKPGQAIDTAVDSIPEQLKSDFNISVIQLGEAFARNAAGNFLAAQGEPETLLGAAEYGDKEIENLISESSLPATVKTGLIDVLEKGFALINTKIPDMAL
jgi:hypothetical protein